MINIVISQQQAVNTELCRWSKHDLKICIQFRRFRWQIHLVMGRQWLLIDRINALWTSDVTFRRAHSRFIFNITVAPANCFTHCCIVTQSPCYGDYGKMRVCAKLCMNQHHSNTEKIHVCELVWRHDFYSVYAVKVRRHTPWSRVRCHGCRFTNSQFHSQFHSRRHSLRITLKYTTLVHMRSGYA